MGPCPYSFIFERCPGYLVIYNFLLGSLKFVYLFIGGGVYMPERKKVDLWAPRNLHDPTLWMLWNRKGTSLH